MKLLKLSDLTHFWGNVRKHIPTKTSDLTNDSNFVDTSNSAVASGITSAKVTSYDSHIADTDIHVTTADKTKWNNNVTQSYVLRYSSASVTDNSTIAYSTLDNTDNIKSGDKVIDVDGKIFSVVSVDTANQTVTVGSALIDLALDANVVHTSGNESISGVKTFSDGTYVKSLNFTNEVPSTSSSQSAILPIYATVTYADQTASKQARLNFRITANEDKSLYPHENNQYALGLTSRKWSEIHGVTYYYGSSDTEFSTKFVTSDTAQTISGAKTFASTPVIYNSDANGSIQNLYFRNQLVTEGDTSTAGSQLIRFSDSSDKMLSRIQTSKISNGDTTLNLRADTVDTNNNDVTVEVQVIAQKDGNKSFSPQSDNTVDLGRIKAKWKNLYINQINGLTPSSLSLPATRDSAIDISSYFTNFNNGDTNQYTPTVNGWIYLETTGCNALHCFCTTTGNLVHYGNTVARANDGMAYVTFPVLANTVFKCTWYTNSTITLNKAWFIPCQGNV